VRQITLAVLGCLLASVQGAAAPVDPGPGRKAVQRSCTPCHSLRLIESQRLSTAAWQKEVDKMIGWGAVVPERQVLIEYLTQHFSNTQPPPAPVLSADRK
jgi:quinoprotein glucose dehydrogenase